MAKPRKQCHKFFKVYLPCLNSQQLKIPPAFVRHFDGNIPKDAVLKNHTGKLWLVNLEEVEGRLTITNGWQCFASENSIEFGDFLTFEYDGKSMFYVELFGRNGCHKAASSSNMATTHAVNDEEVEVVEICSESTQTSELKYSVKNLGSARGSRYKLRRNRGTNVGEGLSKKNVGEGKTLEAATYVTPKGPYFVSNVHKWTRYVVYVPRSLLSSYGIKIKPEMILLDQNGKRWPVMSSFREDGRILINRGWSAFRKEYKLQKGDKCVFEFVLGRGNVCQKLLVQVIGRQPKHHRHRIGKA